MKRRVAAVATAVLASIWLGVAAVKLASGLFGRETTRLELAHPSQGHGQVVTVGVIGLIFVFGILCELIVHAYGIWRGSRRSERSACVLITIILIVTTQEAVKEKTNVAQWLGVALDITALALIALALRDSHITTPGTEVSARA